jgi:hypothetical protein
MLSPSSPEWQETKEWIGGRMKALRDQLEIVGLPVEETNAIRGRVAELRDFMAAVADPSIAKSLLAEKAPVLPDASEALPDYV